MSTPAQELEAKLAAFEKLFPAEGRNLRTAVTTSPELSALLEQAISKGHLDGDFQPVSAAERARGTLGSYHAGGEVLSVPMDYLKAADTNPEMANTLLTTLGHEAAHAINKGAIQNTHEQFDTDMASVASGPPPRDYTATLKGFLDDARQREATDEIGGVNVLAAKIGRENPGATQQQLSGKLYKSTADIEGYFDVSGAEEKPIYTPKPGITFNDQFQIEPNAANVAAFGQHFFDARGYPANYGQNLIDYAGELEAKAQAADLARDPSRPSAPATINLSALGIEPDKVTLPSSVVNGTAPRLAAPVPASPTPPAAGPAPEGATRAGAETVPARLGAAPLSPTSDTLLRDSERFVRQVAEKHHLPWDAGMDNTVHATARGAREAGMTAITHLKVADGTLRFAQHDGYGLKEASMDARVAANTPAAKSLERMEALDHAAPSTLQHPAPQRTPETELAQAR